MLQYTTDEPVYALATAYAPSALAVIRASGENSLILIAPYFSSNLGKAETNSAVHGFIKDENGGKIDEVILIKYEKGHGYTSEEAFEILSHGSLAVIRALSSLLERIGFRMAEKGEFTYRAFMHGRIDLSEAEAVEELVSARGERGRKGALERLTGSLRRETDKIRGELINILASLEVYLDYGEDEIIEDWVFPLERAQKIIGRLKLIASTYRSERIYSQGAKVVLAGRTNAGKSSLFNHLLKENRAIVSPIAGTTRDYLEAECELDGIPVRLFDTAGLRESSDEIEKEGIRITGKMIEDADLVVYVLDGDEEEGKKDDKTIYVHSKRDLTHSTSSLSFSSLTGEGIADVISAITEYLTRESTSFSGVPVIESKRQRDKLTQAAIALEDAVKNKGMSVDIIALYFQSALYSLGEIVGETTSDDVLEELFSSFCLGK